MASLGWPRTDIPCLAGRNISARVAELQKSCETCSCCSRSDMLGLSAAPRPQPQPSSLKLQAVPSVTTAISKESPHLALTIYPPRQQPVKRSADRRPCIRACDHKNGPRHASKDRACHCGTTIHRDEACNDVTWGLCASTRESAGARALTMRNTRARDDSTTRELPGCIYPVLPVPTIAL